MRWTKERVLYLVLITSVMGSLLIGLLLFEPPDEPKKASKETPLQPKEAVFLADQPIPDTLEQELTPLVHHFLRGYFSYEVTQPIGHLEKVRSQVTTYFYYWQKGIYQYPIPDMKQRNVLSAKVIRMHLNEKGDADVEAIVHLERTDMQKRVHQEKVWCRMNWELGDRWKVRWIETGEYEPITP